MNIIALKKSFSSVVLSDVCGYDGGGGDNHLSNYSQIYHS
jgi:hypothetical protein